MAPNCRDPIDELFRQEMGDIEPIEQHQVILRKPTDSSQQSAYEARRKAAAEQQQLPSDSLSDHYVVPVDPEQYLEFQRPGLQDSRMRKLRQGQLPVEYQLDLHGYRVEEARETLQNFVHFCHQRNYRCIKVIHGKAHRFHQHRSILKSYVNNWLCQLPAVMAFCSTPPQDGGRGSVYVLLKQKR